MDTRSSDPQFLERRSGHDRRRKHIGLFSKFLLTGRRSQARREEDRYRLHWIDRHGRKTFVAILFIMCLSVLDALFTLDLVLHKGAVELNPVMAYYLDCSPLVFFWVKYFLTWAAILIILLTKDVYLFKTKFQVKSLFIIISIPFLLVVHWQLYLLFNYSQ